MTTALFVNVFMKTDYARVLAKEAMTERRKDILKQRRENRMRTGNDTEPFSAKDSLHMTMAMLGRKRRHRYADNKSAHAIDDNDNKGDATQTKKSQNVENKLQRKSARTARSTGNIRRKGKRKKMHVKRRKGK